jgi:hypothetical protein
MKWRFCILSMMLWPAALQAAGDAALDRATLKGLKAVGVVIDTLDAELVKQGLAADDLAAHIAKRLSDAGVPVDKNATEFVGIRMLQVHDRKGPYGLCISTGVYQPVVLVRDKNIKTATQTWEVETVVLAEGKQIHDAALDSIDELVDRFVAAWKAATK